MDSPLGFKDKFSRKARIFSRASKSYLIYKKKFLKGKVVALIVYVDGIILTRNDEVELERLKMIWDP
ncbi:hypothetical protein CR513_16616, partial [Mucuna pruriens]